MFYLHLGKLMSWVSLIIELKSSSIKVRVWTNVFRTKVKGLVKSLRKLFYFIFQGFTFSSVILIIHRSWNRGHLFYSGELLNFIFLFKWFAILFRWAFIYLHMLTAIVICLSKITFKIFMIVFKIHLNE